MGMPPWTITSEPYSGPVHFWAGGGGPNCMNNARAPLMQTHSFVPPDDTGSWHMVFRARPDLEYNRDYLSASVSSDDGETWQYFWSITGMGDWRAFVVPIQPGWKKVRLLFRPETNDAARRGGVYLDGIGIWGEPFQPPQAGAGDEWPRRGSPPDASGPEGFTPGASSRRSNDARQPRNPR